MTFSRCRRDGVCESVIIRVRIRRIGGEVVLRGFAPAKFITRSVTTRKLHMSVSSNLRVRHETFSDAALASLPCLSRRKISCHLFMTVKITIPNMSENCQFLSNVPT